MQKGQRDDSQEALREVEKITGSEPVNGEDLLASEDLKRQLREAKEREHRAPEARRRKSQ